MSPGILVVFGLLHVATGTARADTGRSAQEPGADVQGTAAATTGAAGASEPPTVPDHLEDEPAEGYSSVARSEPDAYAESEPELESYGHWTALGYLWFPWTVLLAHGLHGQIEYGFISLLGFPASGFAGALVGMALCDEGETTGRGCFGPMLLGAGVGALSWILFDVIVLSKREVTRSGKVRPFAQVTPGRREVGMRWELAF